MYTSWICVDLNLGICYKNANVVHAVMHVPLTEQHEHVYQRCMYMYQAQDLTYTANTHCMSASTVLYWYMWGVPGPGLSYAVP